MGGDYLRSRRMIGCDSGGPSLFFTFAPLQDLETPLVLETTLRLANFSR